MATTVTNDVNSKVGQLKAILYLLQINLEEFKDEVDRSYALLEVGEKTNLSKKIEKSLENPFESIFNLSSNIDEQIKSIINKIVVSFLKSNSDIIIRAYKTKTSLNDLHFSIVLKEDNIKNRDKIFNFYDKFDLINISKKYPVYFQFVPIELIDKILIVEEIKFQ